MSKSKKEETGLQAVERNLRYCIEELLHGDEQTLNDKIERLARVLTAAKNLDLLCLHKTLSIDHSAQSIEEMSNNIRARLLPYATLGWHPETVKIVIDLLKKKVRPHYDMPEKDWEGFFDRIKPTPREHSPR